MVEINNTVFFNTFSSKLTCDDSKKLENKAYTVYDSVHMNLIKQVHINTSLWQIHYIITMEINLATVLTMFKFSYSYIDNSKYEYKLFSEILFFRSFQ